MLKNYVSTSFSALFLRWFLKCNDKYLPFASTVSWGEMLNNIINGNIYNDVGGFTRFMVYKSISFLSTNHNRLFSNLFLLVKSRRNKIYFLFCLIHI